MSIRRNSLFLALVLVACMATPARAEDEGGFDLTAGEWTGYLGAELRVFPHDGADPRQLKDLSVSLAIEPEYYLSWDGRDQSLRFTPFLRVDQYDERRTHFDVRELYWEYVARAWELRVGIRKIFWGVTESNHLVDIVNQYDGVENLDGEDKLGQPMINFAWVTGDWGTIDFFALFGFRAREFPGPEGRVRFPIVVDTKRPSFDSPLEEASIDVAVRWSNYIGDFDYGLSYFYGTSREPQFVALFLPPAPFSPPAPAPISLVPHYDLVHQVGFDLQWTWEGLLVKVEAIGRFGQGDAFAATTAGFEYSFYGIVGTDWDLGLICEYLYDGRTNTAYTLFDNDIFGGMRLALNDVQSTELLAGAIVDLEDGTTFVNVEASRRLGESWKLVAEARFFENLPLTSAFAAFGKEDYVQIEIQRHF